VYESRIEGKVVLDIGMSNGDTAIYFARRGARKVIGLEPSPESFELAVENIRLNKLEDVIIPLNMALSSREGSAELLISSDNPNANSLEPSRALASKIPFDSRIQVRTTTIEALVKQYDLVRIALLKMDCEGCEYGVIRALQPEILGMIDEIIMEFHSGTQDLPQILVRNGFKVDYELMQIGTLKASH